MIRVKKPAEPVDFDSKVRKRGIKAIQKKILSGNKLKSKDFPTFWLEFRTELRCAFHGLCGYSAMKVNGSGEVDHYISKSNDPGKAYEWSNYRFSSSEMNRRKGNLDNKILDPYEIETEWFEIEFGSFKLVPSGSLPEHLREKAKFTIEKLGLNDENLIQTRIEAVSIAVLTRNNAELLEQIRMHYPMMAALVSKHWNKTAEERRELEEQFSKLARVFESSRTF